VQDYLTTWIANMAGLFDMYTGNMQPDANTGKKVKKAALDAGLLGLGFAPGAGMADYLGYFPSAEGGYEPGAVDNFKQGNYGTAAMQLLGAGGDALYAVPALGATVGSVLKAPRAAQKAMKAAKGAPAKTEFDLAHEAAQRNAALPVEEGGLGLPPDNTATDRARAMGVDSSGFHATGADIKYIDPNSVAQSDYGTIGQGFYIDPSENAAYSNLVARINQAKSPQNIMPVMFDPSDLYDMTNLLGPRSAEQSKQLTENLKKAGYKGTFTRLPDGSMNEVAIFDPSRVRSRFAAFDPMKRNSSNILAGVGAGGIGLGGLLFSGQDGPQY
jgi:hypothetical protein